MLNFAYKIVVAGNSMVMQVSLKKDFSYYMYFVNPETMINSIILDFDILIVYLPITCKRKPHIKKAINTLNYHLKLA